MKLSLSSPLLFFFFSLLIHFSLLSHAQQEYINNVQNDCYGTNASSALGYSCNGPQTSCNSYLTFRSQTLYNSPALVAYLLDANASAISAINNISDVSPVAVGEILIVPAACSCSGQFYQHNASYTHKSLGETYLLIANDTYGGLSTCQALLAQNPYDNRNLPVNAKFLVPLRCACPTSAQIRSGVKYLLTYLVTWNDDVPTIAQRFRADYQSVLDANGLSSKSTIFPFTSLLIPLKTEPTKDLVVTPPPPPPVASPQPPGAPAEEEGSNKKWVFIGIGIGVGFLVLSGIPLWFFCRRRRRLRQSKLIPAGKKIEESVEYGEVSGKNSRSAPLIATEIRRALESLAVYKFEELERATGFFGEEQRIKGSVYRGVINGDDAAIKRLNGDVLAEINILRQINHSSVIRLSGFCIHEGNTYLVYEFAEKGSLSDWLHHKKDASDSCLGWTQRVQIAYDVADGLNYLHNYVNPPYVHKDLKSSNILLDGEFRAKVANFGLARPVGDQEGQQLTRHVVGTQGYMAPEYLEHGLITPKLDVFAFGVVMLELLSGKEAAFHKEGEVKGEVLLWAMIESVLSGDDVRSKLREFVDRSLWNDYPSDLAFAMAELAMRCVSREPSSRPTMTDVFMSLSAIYNSTLDWDPSEVTNSSSMSRGR